METKNSITKAEMEFNKSLENYIFINTKKSTQTSEIKALIDNLLKPEENKFVFYSWLLMHGMGKIFTKGNWEKRSRSLIDEMFINKLVDEMILELSLKTEIKLNNIISILTEYQYWFEKVKDSDESLKTLIQTFISDFNVRSFININRYNGVLWFNKESLETLIKWLEIMGCFSIMKGNYPSLDNIKSDFEELAKIINKVKDALERSEYKLETFLNNLDK